MKTTISMALWAALATTSVSAATLLSRDHTDVGIAFEDGEFDPHVHAEAYELEYAPGAAVLRVLPSAQEVIPASPAYAFLGAAGAPTWILPQDEGTASAKGLLHLGIGAEEVNPVEFAGNLLMTLTGVIFTPEAGGAPNANFAVFTTAGPTPTVLMSTHDGISGADQVSLPPGAHTHVNWAFSQPGRYQVSFHFAGTLASGGTPTAEATYTFVVKSATSPLGTQLAKHEVIAVGTEHAFVTKAAAISVSPNGGGLSAVTIKGFGASASAINSTNDTLLAKVENYTTEIMAREGEGVSGIAGGKIRSFADGFLTDSGHCVYSALLLQGTGGVGKTNDSILLARHYDAGNDTFVQVPVAREGSEVAGLTGFLWTKFLSYLPAEDGSVVIIGSARNPVTATNKTVVVRATPEGLSFQSTLLLATGLPLATDSGLHLVKSITRTTRPGARSIDANGGVELIVGLEDGTTEIVRWANPLPLL